MAITFFVSCSRASSLRSSPRSQTLEPPALAVGNMTILNICLLDLAIVLFSFLSLSLTGISRSVSVLILLSCYLVLVLKSSLVDLGYLFCLVELGRLI